MGSSEDDDELLNRQAATCGLLGITPEQYPAWAVAFLEVDLAETAALALSYRDRSDDEAKEIIWLIEARCAKVRKLIAYWSKVAAQQAGYRRG
jgi:hypothetical protein